MASATRPYHHGNLRSELLAAAERTIGERGVAGLSLRGLARDLGVSHAAPGRHFADKQSLLDELAEEGFEQLGAATGKAIDDAGDGFEQRAKAAASAYVRFATEHAALLELMFASKHRPGAEALQAAGARAFAPLLAVIADGQKAGRLEAGDPERVAILMFATLQGLAAMANGSMLDPAQLDDLVDEAIGSQLRGLRPD
jgi:AcrR family transcriptional regulator